MATYPINDENPPTGAGYRPGDIVVCPPGSVVPRWKYVGDEQWVPANVVEFAENEVTGRIDLIGPGGEVIEVGGGGSAVSTLSASRSLVAGDNGSTLVYGGESDIVLTVPSGLPAGFACTVVQQGGGMVSFAQGAEVGFDNVGGTRGQNTFTTAVQVSTDQYGFQNPVPNCAVALVQMAIPFIGLSSWTFGANGAITLAVALPAAFPAAYVYFPADAVGSGVPAGWYFTTFSSTTAGTVYNNRYVGGKPAIPASPAAFTISAGSVTTQVTTQVTGISITLPGGALGASGYIEAAALWQSNNSAANKVAGVYLASASQIASVSMSSSNVISEIEAKTFNTGVENRQINRTATINSTTGTPNYTTADTSADQPVYTTFTLGTAATGDYVILTRLRVTYQYGA